MRIMLRQIVCFCTFVTFSSTVNSWRFLDKLEDAVDRKFGLGYERCSGIWIQPNFTALEEDLHENVYGQHLVNAHVPNLIEGHYSHANPSKALVISFHGWTGVGKNYVSNKLVTHLFKRGIKSKFVQQFIATVDFADASRVEEYKQKIQEKISGTVKKCRHSLFIFDEVEKIPAGVLDAIKAYIDHNVHIHNVDYRHSIFIFLSNTGGTEITRTTLQHWRDGKSRQDLRLKDVEPLLQQVVFNEGGGLFQTLLIDHSLVSAFIPFLPLQREHVKLCIRKDALSKGRHLDDDAINSIADELEYFPDNEQLFSRSGCKRVTEKVNMYLVRRRQRQQTEL